MANDIQAITGHPKHSRPPSQPVPAIRVCLSLQGLKGTDFCFPGLTCPYDKGTWPALANRVWQKKICWRLPEKFSVPSRNDVHEQIDFVFFYWLGSCGLLDVWTRTSFFLTFHIQLLHKSFQLYLQNILRITSFSKSPLTWLLAIFS